MNAETSSAASARRLVAALLVVAAAFFACGSFGAGRPAFGQPVESLGVEGEMEPAAEAAAPEGEAPAEPRAEGGLYVNPFWLLFFVVCAVVWLYLNAWVCEDAEGVGVAPLMWTSILFGSGLVGFLCAVLFHAAFGFLILGAVGVGVIFYMRAREEALPQQYKVLGAAHRRAVAQKLMFWKRAPAEAAEALQTGFALRRADGGTLEQLVEMRGELVDAASMATRWLTTAIQARGRAVQLGASAAGAAVRVELDGVMQVLEAVETDVTPGLLMCLSWLSGQERKGERASSGQFYTDVPGEGSVEIAWRTRKSTKGLSVTLSLPDWTAEIYKEGLAGLGMYRPMAERMEKIARRDRGAILVSGPPRSGTTTTLYATVGCIDIFTTDVLSIEERIEHELEQVKRMALKPSEGQTFEKVYTLAMREEPHVLVFGELKERASARQLFEFAQGEGLLLSTVKADRAVEALPRLAAMGVDYGALAASALCVVNQRLVRTLCEACKEQVEPDPAVLRRLKIDPQKPGMWFKPVGCERCLRTGFSGRTGVFEMLVITDPIRKLLLKGAESPARASAQAISKAAGTRSLRTLEAEALMKVKEGITTLDEVRRCLGG